MGSDAGGGVEAPESPLAQQHSSAMRGSATTSVPSSPSEDAAATAAAADDDSRGHAGGQAAADLLMRHGSPTAAGFGQRGDDASDGESIYPDSDGPGGGDAYDPHTDANGLPAEGQGTQTELQQALARISQLEDQNVALWQASWLCFDAACCTAGSHQVACQLVPACSVPPCCKPVPLTIR